MGTFVLLKNIPVYQDANLFGVKIIHRNGELCLYDNYSVSNGITPLQAHDITDYVYRDKNLKRYFDYELLSRNHLLFLPLRRNDNEPCDIVEDALYSMNPSCNIFMVNSFWVPAKYLTECLTISLMHRKLVLYAFG